ncbi:hypothetical protein [Pollutimonas bauzanensis]|uniref:hypothetical protein n=1 Tax=Pollutimonas bauzanensis TaxID=658167 RepID=UPI0015B5A62F|nr:hypothetical protein [Pollutimonas bauzanensis]
MYSPPPTKQEVVAALDALKNIARPEGDNEGEPINSPNVYPLLTPEDQDLVDDAERIAKEYLRRPGDHGDEPNARAITELRKAGFNTSLNPDQYDQDILVGEVEISDEVVLDVGDRTHQSNDN